MKQILSSTRKVRFQDCDPFNHLNNAKYLEYFINAREDQLIESYDFDIYKLAATKGISWVVASSQIYYIKPAFTMETVCIESQLIASTDTSLLVEMKMWDEKKAKLKSLLWINFIHFDLKTQARTIHSAELNALFNEILLPVDQASFEERGNFLIKQSKNQ